MAKSLEPFKKFKRRVPSTSESNQDEKAIQAANQRIADRNKRGHLERGWMRTRLIVELAKEEKTQRELARMFDCTQGSIAQFKKRNLVEIEECKGRLTDEFVSLWAAMKSARISEYLQDIVDCNALIREEMQKEDPDLQNVNRIMASKHKAVRSIAEELGQIPRAMDLKIDEGTIRMIFEGVDKDALT